MSLSRVLPFYRFAPTLCACAVATVQIVQPYVTFSCPDASQEMLKLHITESRSRNEQQVSSPAVWSAAVISHLYKQLLPSGQ